MQTGANEAQIGLMLLCFGGASLISLLASVWFLKRFESRNLILFCSSIVLLATVFMGSASCPYILWLCAVMGGFATGFVDVAINSQGIQLKKSILPPVWHLCMSPIVLAVLSGHCQAHFLPFLTNAVVMLGYMCFFLKAYQHLLSESVQDKEKAEKGKSIIPFFVVFCGLLTMLEYACEGAVAEWGSLFMHDIKLSPEYIAALVYAGFPLHRCAAVFLQIDCGNILET